MSEVLVRPGNMPDFRTTREQLRIDVESGRAPAHVIVSLDDGATWLPAWNAAGLAPPPSSTDDAAKYFIPIGRSGWAIVTGYLSLVTLFVILVSGFMLVAVIDSPAKASDIARGALILATIGIPAQLVTALLGHRAIRQNPKLLGMGRVIFTYVCSGLLAVITAAILVVGVVAS